MTTVAVKSNLQFRRDRGLLCRENVVCLNQRIAETLFASGTFNNDNNYTYKAQISTKCSSALNTDYIKYCSNN